MAPETWAKSVQAGEKDPNPKQTIKSKLHIHTHEDVSQNKCESVEFADAQSVEFSDTQSVEFSDAKSEEFSDAQSVEFGDAKSEEFADAQSVKFIGSIATRSEDTLASQGTTNAAANASASATPLDSIEPVDPRKSAEVPTSAVLPAWNGRRRRIACSKSFYFQYTYKRLSGLLTRDELEVANFLVTKDFRSKWALGSTAVTMVQMKKDPIHLAPV